jgi:hypothetical protein
MTVDEFERIADALDDDQVELINGYIVGKENMKPSHVVDPRSELRATATNPSLTRFGPLDIGWGLRHPQSAASPAN